jgi:8-oxo-dGTP pyrophosphatase MutT (NUDIX family)
MPLSGTASVLEAIRGYRPRSVVAKGFKLAGILVPIEIAGEHCLTLIERAATLRLHGSEMAFPGGNVTAKDKDALAAALREFQEEIGGRSRKCGDHRATGPSHGWFPLCHHAICWDR